MKLEIKDIESLCVRNVYKAILVKDDPRPFSVISYITTVDLDNNPNGPSINYSFTSEKFRNMFTNSISNLIETVKKDNGKSILFTNDKVVVMDKVDRPVCTISYDALYEEDLKYA